MAFATSMAYSTRLQQHCAKPRLRHEAELEVDLTAREHDSDASIGEFELIERFFGRPTPVDAYVALGTGDDCALLAARPGEQWAVSTDTLIEGTHFFSGVDPLSLIHISE